MDIEVLRLLVVVFALAIGVVTVFHRIRIPAIIGFLITGIIVGPHGLGIAGSADVELLAEIGIVLLLFTVGIEFSVQGLRRVKRSFLVGGSLQVSLTTGALAMVGLRAGLTAQQSVFFGFLVALSSTAIVMKLLQDRGEVDSPHGQIVIAVSIFQDIIAVLVMLFIPLLAGKEGVGLNALVPLGKGLLMIAAVMVCGMWLVPKLLHVITRTRNPQVFVLAVVVICFTVAWITGAAGLGLALGAFLAGLILSGSDYGNQALANVLPFRDLFMSLFFISVGMLLNVRVFFDNPWLMVFLALGIVALKAVIGAVAALLLGMPLRVAVLVGFALASMSEFAFVLAQAARDAGLIDLAMRDTFLVVAVITMAIAPLVFAFSPRVAASLTMLRSFNARDAPVSNENKRKDHLIIVGFGLNGVHVAKAASDAGIPHMVIDMNPERVREERAAGRDIIFGDATAQVVLEEAGIHDAGATVVAITDVVATRGIVAAARRANPGLTIIARTLYGQNGPLLKAAGADVVVVAEYQSSLELCRAVLRKYGVEHVRMDEFFKSIGAKRTRE